MVDLSRLESFIQNYWNADNADLADIHGYMNLKRIVRFIIDSPAKKPFDVT